MALRKNHRDSNDTPTTHQLAGLLLVSLVISGFPRIVPPYLGGLPSDSLVISLLAISVAISWVATFFKKTNRTDTTRIPKIIWLLLAATYLPKIIGFNYALTQNPYIYFFPDIGKEVIALAIFTFTLKTTNRNNIFSAGNIILAMAALTIVAGFGAKLTGSHVISILGNNNYTGALLAIAVPFVLGLRNITYKWIQVVTVIIILISILGLFNHRAGFVAGLVGVAVSGFFAYPNGRKTIIILFLVASSLGLAAIANIKSDVTNASKSLSAIERITSSTSWRTRTDQYKISLEAIKDSPIIGFGSGSYADISYKYGRNAPGSHTLKNDTNIFTNPHNDFLENMIEGGLVSAISYHLFVLLLLINLYKKSNQRNAHGTEQHTLVSIYIGSITTALILGLISISNQTSFISALIFMVYANSAYLISSKK